MLERNILLLATDEMILFMNDKLEQLKFIKPDQLDPCVNYVTCFTQDLGSGFLLACQAVPE